MEIHNCKLSTKTFVNGKALGGHMKSHLATLPLPTKKTMTKIHHHDHHHQLGTESASSSYSLSSDDEDVEEKGLVYGLRENPKKNFKLADPEFSFPGDVSAVASVVVVQDRESETESRNPTRRRSKRTRKSGFLENHHKLISYDVKKLKFKHATSVMESPSPSPPPAVEPEPVSSVSDTSPELEDVAMCLMMLSRDARLIRNKNNKERDQEQADDTKKQEIIVKVGKFRCEKCRKLFRSSQALVSHKKICCLNGTELRNNNRSNIERIFECPYCFKVFGSGQALGGHKRSHLMGSSANASSATATAGGSVAENSFKKENKLIDLNLPAPVEDDDYSVVSEA